MFTQFDSPVCNCLSFLIQQFISVSVDSAAVLPIMWHLNKAYSEVLWYVGPVNGVFLKHYLSAGLWGRVQLRQDSLTWPHNRISFLQNLPLKLLFITAHHEYPHFLLFQALRKGERKKITAAALPKLTSSIKERFELKRTAFQKAG